MPEVEDLAIDIDSFLIEPGIWIQRLDAGDMRDRRALFLDRDGVINEDTGYPSTPAEIVIRKQIIPVLKTATDLKLPIIVVTNQSGIARGLFNWRDFGNVNSYLLQQLAHDGISVSMVLACGYHLSGAAPYRFENHPMRKPNPGMLLAAERMTSIDLHRSLIIGDKLSDMVAGSAAGLSRGWFISDEQLDTDLLGTEFSVSRLSPGADPRPICDDLMTLTD